MSQNRAYRCVFFFQAEDGIRDTSVTGVQTCALPISLGSMLGLSLFLRGSGVRTVCSYGNDPFEKAPWVAALAGADALVEPRKFPRDPPEIGRASCRERVWMWVVAGAVGHERANQSQL